MAILLLTASLLFVGSLHSAPIQHEPKRDSLHTHLADDQSAPVPRLRHTFLLGVAYEPRPGPRIFAQYAFRMQPSGFITTEVGWSRQFFGALSYTHVPEFGAWGERRLTISPSIFSEFEPNRSLNDVRTHERRTGISLLVASEAPLPGRWRYNQSALAELARLRFDPENQATFYRDLTMIEASPRLLRRAMAGLLPVDLLLEARTRMGWDHNIGTIFGGVLVGARWHRPISGGFASNTEILAEWVSDSAPMYERASFGGAHSVRGYLSDFALGRATWRLQQELWIAVPGTVGAQEGIALLLGRYVRLAAFFDAGGVTGTTGARDAGVRAGTGLGLRLRLGGVTLRADWAHALPEFVEDRLKGRFSVSLRPDITLLLFD